MSRKGWKVLLTKYNTKNMNVYHSNKNKSLKHKTREHFKCGNLFGVLVQTSEKTHRINRPSLLKSTSTLITTEKMTHTFSADLVVLEKQTFATFLSIYGTSR